VQWGLQGVSVKGTWGCPRPVPAGSAAAPAQGTAEAPLRRCV